MSLCLPDKTLLWRPSDALLPNPHKGFVSFRRFAGDQLNDNWSADRVRFATDGETDDGFLKTGAFVALKEVSVRK